MNLIRVQNALRKVAEADGVSVEKVVEDINYLISRGYSCFIETGNMEMLAKWNEIPKENEIPTAYEFIDYMADYVDEIISISSYLSMPDVESTENSCS